MADHLHARARTWISADPDDETRRELCELLNASENGDPSAHKELVDRFDGTLEFGTAGLRGALAAGPNRMNRLVARRAAAGLGAYLTANNHRSALIVIGYDARLKSRDMAIDSAGVLVHQGHRVALLPRALPTPVLAFAVRALDAEAGIMVTASHNPAADNGYKVYLGGTEHAGAQLVSPHDQSIATAIGQVPDGPVLASETGWDIVPETLIERYLHAVTALVPSHPRPLTIVTTPIHGVGGELAEQLLTSIGVTRVETVTSQRLPDPHFPGTPFPNPELPGVLDAAIAQAKTVQADVVIAQDPDADRCAAAIPLAGAAGQWRTLTGDEIGCLLGEYIAQRWSAGQWPPTGTPAPSRAVFASSVVSSRRLARIAAAHHIDHQTTLTGFKWLARVPNLTYSYEEALGFCVAPWLVKDKDGLSAAVLMADLASLVKGHGGTLLEELDRLDRLYGTTRTSQITAPLRGGRDPVQVMNQVKASLPELLADATLTECHDLSQGWQGLPPTVGLLMRTSHDDQIVIRPSGTEPKVKVYLETWDPPGMTPPVTPADQRMTHLRMAVPALLTALG